MVGVGEREQPALNQLPDSERARQQRARGMVDDAQGFAEWLSPAKHGYTLYALPK